MTSWRKQLLDVGFERSRYGTVTIPSYPTGQIGFMLSEKKVFVEPIEYRYQQMAVAGGATTHYHPRLQERYLLCPRDHPHRRIWLYTHMAIYSRFHFLSVLLTSLCGYRIKSIRYHKQRLASRPMGRTVASRNHGERKRLVVGSSVTNHGPITNLPRKC